jgi:hypothetical protein
MDKGFPSSVVFDETMCRRHYLAPARGKAAASPSSFEDDQ